MMYRCGISLEHDLRSTRRLLSLARCISVDVGQDGMHFGYILRVPVKDALMLALL